MIEVLTFVVGLGVGIGGSYYVAMRQLKKSLGGGPAELLAMLPPEIQAQLTGLKNG